MALEQTFQLQIGWFTLEFDIRRWCILFFVFLFVDMCELPIEWKSGFPMNNEIYASNGIGIWHATRVVNIKKLLVEAIFCIYDFETQSGCELIND